MIILDTNVISELMRPFPSDSVRTWISDRLNEDLRTTSITVAEILFGIRRLPQGRRRRELDEGFETLMAGGFREKLFGFDEPAAAAYADIVADRMARGRPVDVFDAMIAGIALSVGAAVATRDVRGFEGHGVTVLNPWA